MNNDKKADFESLMILRSAELIAIKDRVYHLIKDLKRLYVCKNGKEIYLTSHLQIDLN